jgi:triphosphoribosyl-dephospho-CoA synthase
MALAADRDLVARQYANGFREVFEDGVPALIAGIEKTRCLEGAIIHCHLALLAKHPDSLIARKRGIREAEEASRRALAVLEGRAEITDLDAWLQAEGRGRNPGTTADLVTACLFVALRTQVLTLPLTLPWTIGDRII